MVSFIQIDERKERIEEKQEDKKEETDEQKKHNLVLINSDITLTKVLERIDM